MTKLILPAHRSTQTGTYNIDDSRGSDMLIAQFGLANAMSLVSQQLQAYNATMQDSLTTLAEVTTERLEIFSNAVNVRMTRTDEFGKARTQKTGSNVGRGFPLEDYQFATGWTSHFRQTASVGQLVGMNDRAMLAHTNQIRTDLAAALYNPVQRELSEYMEAEEVYQVTQEIFVKPLYNGDGEVPSVGPNGESFDGNHNHYLAVDGLTEAAVEEATRTVGEHSTGNNLVIYINVADAGKFRALPGFVPATILQVSNGIAGATTSLNLDVSQSDNRQLGYTADGTLVQTKPWALKNYALVINLNAGSKVLKMRVPRAQGMRGLFVKATDLEVNLAAQYWEALHGFGVSNRAGAAVLYFGAKPQGANSAVYVAPAELN